MRGGDEERGQREERDFIRPTVNPLASPRGGRKDLTISTLIAECEDYVQTDKFTRDLSEELVTLFRAEKPASGAGECSSPPPRAEGGDVGSGGERSREPSGGKPPRIPDTMRSRSLPRPEKGSQPNTPKFPLTLRGSTYDNVGESEGEDEGIDPDYSDDSVGRAVCSQCSVAGCREHESSPALTSEGYDSSGQESGE